MLSTAEERLEGLWLKAITARDPSEKDILLFEFRDAVPKCVTNVADKANHFFHGNLDHEWILSSIDQGRRCSRVHFMESVGMRRLI
jgi:hypothetical protein